jgi:protein-S-isoprenylcysteine O-methyltransferase Ste14
VRHPIYGGIILAVIGTTIIFLSPLGSVFIPIIIAFFFVKSRYEEGRLGVRYGEYEGYVEGTKRFVPFLW